MSRKKNNFQVIDSTNDNSIVIEKSKLCKVKHSDLKQMRPKNLNQKLFWDLYDKSSKAILLHGVAGTGKTYIALFKALDDVLDYTSTYNKVVIVRSAVPSREIGHLPGDEKEKSEVYQQPYIQICSELFNHIQPYARLQEQKSVQFMITSYVRGITLDNAIVIVDECQNMTDMELNSIMTRIGENSRIIFCGDFRQTDLYKKNDMSGLQKFIGIAELMPSFHTVEFGYQDIVRSDLVKEYILARLEYEDRHC
jgi:phosphate starvation-inducible PhoH-like protein